MSLMKKTDQIPSNQGEICCCPTQCIFFAKKVLFPLCYLCYQVCHVIMVCVTLCYTVYI